MPKNANRAALAAAVKFFAEHAGYSYGANETPEQGRQRCARALARAERAAINGGFSFRWSVDPDQTSAEFCEPGEDGGRDNRPWRLWQCAMYNGAGLVVESLHGIDFGRDGEPWGEPYRRVVEAEMAQEGLHNAPQGRDAIYWRRDK